MNPGKRHENLVLALCVLSLAVLGLIMIYSATNVMAGSSPRYGFDPAYFFKRQVLFLAIGISIAMGLSRLDHDFYRRRIGWFLGAAILLLLLVYFPGIKHTANGASRWINLRLFTFQPSEFAKFVLLAFAAWGIDRNGENPKKGYRAFLPMLAVMGLFVAVILQEPDFGMAVVILVSFLTIVFIAGFPWKLLAAFAAAGAAGAAVLILAKPYRIARIDLAGPDVGVPGGAVPDRLLQRGSPRDRRRRREAEAVLPAGNPHRLHLLGDRGGARVCRRDAGRRMLRRHGVGGVPDRAAGAGPVRQVPRHGGFLRYRHPGADEHDGGALDAPPEGHGVAVPELRGELPGSPSGGDRRADERIAQGGGWPCHYG